MADSLQLRLEHAINAVLARLDFAPPASRDCNITDAYAGAAADAVLQQLEADGWLLVKGPGEWPDFRDMNAAELRACLRSSLYFPLLKARKPPRRRDPAEVECYHGQVAADVAAHIVLSGWKLAPAIVKQAPTRGHSTPG